MKTSRTRRRLGLRLAVSAGIAAVLVPASMSAAQAATPKPPPAVVKANDAYVQSRCTFTVTSVNYAAGTLRGRLTTQTRASNFAAASSTAHVAVSCHLFSDGYTYFLDTISDENNGIATYESEIVSVPLFPSYELCVQGTYTLRNGTTTGFAGCS